MAEQDVSNLETILGHHFSNGYAALRALFLLRRVQQAYKNTSGLVSLKSVQELLSEAEGGAAPTNRYYTALAETYGAELMKENTSIAELTLIRPRLVEDVLNYTEENDQ